MNAMNAMDAWNLIQPYINPMENPQLNNAEMAEAFCMVYIACKKYDKKDNNVLLKQIIDSGDCNCCKRKNCKYKPPLGHLVRYNCMFYKGADHEQKRK